MVVEGEERGLYHPLRTSTKLNLEKNAWVTLTDRQQPLRSYPGARLVFHKALLLDERKRSKTLVAIQRSPWISFRLDLVGNCTRQSALLSRTVFRPRFIKGYYIQRRQPIVVGSSARCTEKYLRDIDLFTMNEFPIASWLPLFPTRVEPACLRKGWDEH